MLGERLLHRVQGLAVRQPLDGGDVEAVERHGEHKARVRPPPVHEDGAGPALAVVAALLGAREAHPLAQQVEQRRARIELERVLVTVDPECDGGELKG